MPEGPPTCSARRRRTTPRSSGSGSGPGVESKPAAKEAVEDVAKNPKNEDALGALRNQLTKLLEEDEALRADLTKIWDEAKAANVVTASGERSVAVGGDVSGSSIITGDQVNTDRP